MIYNLSHLSYICQIIRTQAQFMQNSYFNPITTGLLQVKLLKINSMGDKKLSNSKFVTRIGQQGYTSIFDLSKGQVKLQQIRMFECSTLDTMQLEYKSDKNGEEGELRFPLKKITEMPRVKHCIEAVLIKKVNKDKRSDDKLKIQSLLEVQLELIFLNAIQGKFIIQNIEVQLTRSTEMIGEMDPYIVLQLDNQKYQTRSKNNQGRHCVWTEKIEFEIINSGRSKLILRVFDKDPLKDDLVCQCQILLLKQGLLYASQKTKERQFSLLYDQKSAGIVKIEYHFDILPFNF